MTVRAVVAGGLRRVTSRTARLAIGERSASIASKRIGHHSGIWLARGGARSPGEPADDAGHTEGKGAVLELARPTACHLLSSCHTSFGARPSWPGHFLTWPGPTEIPMSLELLSLPVCEIHLMSDMRHAHRRAAHGEPNELAVEKSSFQLKNEPFQFVSLSFTRSAGGSFMISSKRIALAVMQRRPRFVARVGVRVGLVLRRRYQGRQLRRRSLRRSAISAATVRWLSIGCRSGRSVWSS